MLRQQPGNHFGAARAYRTVIFTSCGPQPIRVQSAPQPKADSINPQSQYAEPSSWEELPRLSDAQVIACLQGGQKDALAVLFDRYQKLVLSIALKIVRDRGEAEEVTQTVFLDIYRAVAQFDPRKGSTKVWLMQYAYHRAINRRQHLRGRDFYQNTELEEEALESGSPHNLLSGTDLFSEVPRLPPSAELSHLSVVARFPRP